MVTTIKNQPLKWHGGKSYLAKWIHSLAPPSVIDDPKNGYTHRNIAYAGGLGEFWNWQPVEGISEAVNDRNFGLTTLWCVIAHPDLLRDFRNRLEFSTFSDKSFLTCKRLYAAIEEFVKGNQNDEALVDLATAFFIRYRQSRQGLGKDYATPTTRTRRGMNENVSAWLSAVDGLPECHERLRRVEIRNMDAVEFIQAYDHPRALFYLDPPYLHETRKSTGEYGEHEMTEADHCELLHVLADIEGKFMLSGYPSPMYLDIEADCEWRRHEKEIDNKASSAKTKRKQTECLWTNY